MPVPIHPQIAIMLHVTQQVVLLLACIDYHNKIHGKRNLLHCSIVMPGQSAWQHLYKNADSGSFTLMTGTHMMGCNQIKTVFDQEYKRVITLNGNNRISRFYFNT